MTAKEDLLAIMNAVPDGYGAVRKAVIEGRISGLFPYVIEDCGCIKAHLAHHRHVLPGQLPGCARLSTGSRIERYIISVAREQTPENCPILRDVLGWLEEWKRERDEGVEL